VETVVRTLRPAVIGRRILNAEFRQFARADRRSLRNGAIAGRPEIKGVDRHASSS